MIKFYFAISLALFSLLASAQPIQKEINLAGNIEKMTEPIETGKTIEIIIKNKSLVNSYEISVNRSFKEIPFLPPITTLATRSASDPCASIRTMLVSMSTESDESKLGMQRGQLENLMGQVTEASCSSLNDAKLLLEKTDQKIEIGALKKGEILEIIIKRNGPSPKTWSVTYSTGDRGSWKVSYGFAFIPNAFSKEKKYYLDANNKITKENSNGLKWDYAPSVFFNWFPASAAGQTLSVGLSGGLGVNFNASPIVFLGASLTYNYNISVNVGLVAHELKFLKGRYKEGDVINENNFDEDDGLHQKLFKINPCISVSFRFEQNPFK